MQLSETGKNVYARIITNGTIISNCKILKASQMSISRRLTNGYGKVMQAQSCSKEWGKFLTATMRLSPQNIVKQKSKLYKNICDKLPII